MCVTHKYNCVYPCQMHTSCSLHCCCDKMCIALIGMHVKLVVVVVVGRTNVRLKSVQQTLVYLLGRLCYCIHKNTART